MTKGDPSGPWEEFWRDAGGDGEVMGGEGQKPALDAFWRAFLGGAEFRSDDLILDLASGAGPIARLAHEEMSADRRPRILCADYAPSALTAARRLAGAGIWAVACDARRPPFAPGGFRAVVSQFGLEYVGAAGFAAAAPMLAAGGRMAALVHIKGGLIEAECAENGRMVEAALRAGLIAKARAAISASFRGDAPGKPVSVDPRAEKALATALRETGALLARAEPSTARDLIARYAGDVARVVERRAAFAPGEALGWLGAVEARLRAYARRMSSMVEAARGEKDMAAVAGALAAAGLVDIQYAPLYFAEEKAPGAWRLEARRP